MANTTLFNIKDATDYYTPLAGVLDKPHYVFAARSTPWSNDLTIPEIEKSPSFTDYQIFDELLFGKRITESDTIAMTNRYDWTYGTIYDVYDANDSSLKSKQFFVVYAEGGSYHVFKCLDNNGGSQSIYPPKLSETTVSDSQYYTADGYHWKYIYTITSANFTKFATPSYIPVYPNTAVIEAATNGSIDNIVVNSGGSNYYSYLNGVFEEVAVEGNTLVFSISPTLTAILGANGFSGTFTLSEFVTQANTGATGYVKLANSTTVILDRINGQFQSGKRITGGTSSASANVQTISSTGASSNTNFYTDSAIYIKTGPGAGEVRTIAAYAIDGTKRKIVVNTPFSVLPDLTSSYEIAPRVVIAGDGTGALAISTVNTATKAIQSVRMIQTGSGYTYANVYVVGNTGGLTVANSAAVSASIAPKGGHGSDPAAELYASKVGVSVSFSNTDTQIPTEGSFRRIGVLSSPTYDGVVLNYANATGSYVVGERVVQQKTQSTDVSVYNTEKYDYSHTYDVSKYSVLQFSAAVAFANDNFITNVGNTVNGVVINKLSTNSILVRRDAGAGWTNSTSLVLGSNNLVNGTISSISGGYSNGMIYGRDNANTLFAYDSSVDYVRVYVGNTEMKPVSEAAVSDPQFTINSTAIVITNQTISNSSLIYVDRYVSNLAIATITSNTAEYITGTVTATNATSVTLNGVTGVFAANGLVIGQDSTACAAITTVTGQETAFDARVKLTGTYEAGSGSFASQDQVFQYDASNTTILALGTVHSVTSLGSNNYTVNLTNVKGEFAITANAVNKYIRTAAGNKVLKVNAKTDPYIVPYTGQVLYVENALPVTRSNTSTEVIRLVLSFD